MSEKKEKFNAYKEKCDGNCGMNYCDEYGCIENKPEGVEPSPKPQPSVNHITEDGKNEFGKALEELHKHIKPSEFDGFTEDGITGEIAGKLDEGYKLIPMPDIEDEARQIAVRWAENNGYDWIGDKHKLASDIMNYAKKQLQTALASRDKRIKELEETVKSADKCVKYWNDESEKDKATIQEQAAKIVELKRLLENTVKDSAKQVFQEKWYVDETWQQFQKKHGLTNDAPDTEK